LASRSRRRGSDSRYEAGWARPGAARLGRAGRGKAGWAWRGAAGLGVAGKAGKLDNVTLRL
jgi:hypothetical protein